MSEFQIILPPRADPSDALEAGLVELTEAISKVAPDMVAGGCLGGEFGYGAYFENEVFMMRPYCWCERVDCLWCCVWLSNEVEATEEESLAHRQKQEAALLARYGQFAADYPRAPNFWHKPSGLQARWYKWIGRDTEAHIPDGVDVAAVIRECIDSVKESAHD